MSCNSCRCGAASRCATTSSTRSCARTSARAFVSSIALAPLQCTTLHHRTGQLRARHARARARAPLSSCVRAARYVTLHHNGIFPYMAMIPVRRRSRSERAVDPSCALWPSAARVTVTFRVGPMPMPPLLLTRHTRHLDVRCVCSLPPGKQARGRYCVVVVQRCPPPLCATRHRYVRCVLPPAGQTSAWQLLRRCGSKVPPSVMCHTRHRYVRFVLPPGKEVAFDYDPTYAHEANV